jgi:adenine C2-methylase RlmN of 23S rRNA A2503 and tRNA A37
VVERLSKRFRRGEEQFRGHQIFGWTISTEAKSGEESNRIEERLQKKVGQLRNLHSVKAK